MIEIPILSSDDAMLFDVWFSSLINDFFHVLKKDSHIREYEIVEYRFGLNDKPQLTLEDTGIIFEVSRERIRQIEHKALEDLAEIINTGENRDREIRLSGLAPF